MSYQGHDIARKLLEVDEQERKLNIQKALTLEKALKSGDVDTIYKAQNYLLQQQANNKGLARPTVDGMKAIVLDPYEVSGSMGYFSKNTNITSGILRGMARTPIISAVIRKRQNQFSDFAKPQPDKYSNGFSIRKVGVKEGGEVSDRDKRNIETLTNFMMNCGDEDHKWQLDDFNVFSRKIVADSLTMDAGTFEIVPNMLFEPQRFHAVDGGTIRFADSYDNVTNIQGKIEVAGYYPRHVQVVDGVIKAEFYPWELCYGVRNPSTSIYSNNYGRSELEDLITTVTNILNSDQYNGDIFKKGAQPKGALMVKKGNINKDAIAQIRRDWNAMVAGASGSGKTLILDAESVDWVDMQTKNRDMEYSEFNEYLIKMICAVFCISPEEIGFPLAGKHKGMGSKEGGKDEKDYSITNGLKPLLTFVQSWINKFLIGPKTNFTYEFVFAGLEVESAKEEEEKLNKAVTTYMTPDEVRAGKGWKPLPNGMGALPLNPVIAQMAMGQQQAKQEQQAGKEEGDKEEFTNTNPFLDSEEDREDSPFQKAAMEFFEERYVIK